MPGRNPEVRAEEIAAEERLEEIAARVLAVPPHLIDRAITAEWEASIVNDSSMLSALSDWVGRLIEDDPTFLRIIFERWRDVVNNPSSDE